MTAALFVLPLGASAQTLNVPLASGSRPIQTETLFHELFADFFKESDGTTYVQTGDIPAMWLRDSAAQTIPYVRFARSYSALHGAFYGVIQRDAKNILTDPYAEAFSADYHVWERKWEIDSLAWPVLLVFVYYANTRDRTIFTPTLHRAMQTIVSTLECEQRHASCSRYAWAEPVPTHQQYNPNTRMIWSAFRPSDDPVTYRFNVPQNAMAVVAMRLLARFAREAFKDDALAQRATTLAAQVETGVLRYGKVYNRKYGWMYVYETDGYGHDNMMDDANIPNLTTLPWYGWCATLDPVYLDTRRFTLSFDDPYYYTGKYATGLGSPHTPKGWVWPLGIIGAALTATKRGDVVNAIDMLDRSDTLNGPDARVGQSQRSGTVHPAGVRMGERVLGRLALSHRRRVFGDADRIFERDGSLRAPERDSDGYAVMDSSSRSRRAEQDAGRFTRARTAHVVAQSRVHHVPPG